MIFLKMLLLSSFFSPVALAKDLGIYPDCREKKIRVEDLLKVSKQPSLLHFLRAIPAGSLQTFTFVTDTNSFQHHKTGGLWPRVLRASTDGKLALSFVCNPESQDYGRVEVLYYEEPPVAKWRSVSLDFRAKKMSFAGLSEDEIYPARAGQTSHRDSMTCAKCHSQNGRDVLDLVPIVPQYKTWSGFYGSDDDVVHTGTSEYSNYERFLRHAKKDACFKTLPWPKKKDPAFRLYPYHKGFSAQKLESGQYSLVEEGKQIKIRDYHLRPNLKLTDAFSHLMAQRLAWKFLRSEEYRKVAPLLMMEAVDCDPAAELEKALPGYKSPTAILNHTNMDPRTAQSWTKHLFAVGERLGFRPSDWALHFNQADNAYYNTGAAGEYGKDISIGKMAQGVLINHLAEKFPVLKGQFTVSRGVSKFFHPQDFSCIDDVAGQIVMKDIPSREKFCATLRGIQGQRYEAEQAPSRVAEEEAILPAAEILRPLFLKAFDIASVARGKELTKMHCFGCHGNVHTLPKAYHFLESEQALAERISERPDFIWTVMAYLDSGRMPKVVRLTDEEKKAIQSYFLSRTLRSRELSSP